MNAQPMLATVSTSQNDAEVSALLTAIREIDRISNEEWERTLNDRKKKEIEFHDMQRARAQSAAPVQAPAPVAVPTVAANNDQPVAVQAAVAPITAQAAAAPVAAPAPVAVSETSIAKLEGSQGSDTFEKFYGNLKYYSATTRSNNFVRQWVAENAKGKVFLDYACGNGGNAIAAAQAGAKLAMGLDISPVSVQNARADAAKQDVSGNTAFFQADAENTKLPDNSVDVIICSGMLHHLDLSYAFPELRRILKPGGKILAVEALDYNPMIKLYRMMTPNMRTDWEKAHILSHKDLRFGSRFFDVSNVRYWHILGITQPHLPASFAKPVNMIDKILEKIPGIQMMAWIFTFELVKPAEA